MLGLTGADSGRDSYEEQVEAEIGIGTLITPDGIVGIFPQHVALIGSSFVRDFSKELIIIQAADVKIVHDFYEDLKEIISSITLLWPIGWSIHISKKENMSRELEYAGRLKKCGIQ